MSRIKRTHKGILHFSPIEDVFLNKDGVKIGQIVDWMGKKAYVSWRGKDHYYINERGFAIDKSLLNNLMMEKGIEYIIIDYKGVKGRRYYISTIDEWINHGIPLNHVKDRGDKIETYGIQSCLCEDWMEEVQVV